jgi:deoxyribose-phosphate aldolase
VGHNQFKESKLIMQFQFHHSQALGLLCFVAGAAIGAFTVMHCPSCKKGPCCGKKCKKSDSKSILDSLVPSTQVASLSAEDAAIAATIDHTVLKQTCTLADITKLCKEAITYRFASVCVPPHWAPQAKQLVAGSSVKVAIVIGFPFGYSHLSAKIAETVQAVLDDVDEIDIVANVCAIKSGDWVLLQEEIRAIQDAARAKPSMKTKVIIESGVLTDEEIIKCCEIYGAASIDYLKTSTGYAEKGASVHAVTLFRANLPAHVQIKASGGIRTRADALAMISAGATRLGCSAGVSIVTESSSGKAVESKGSY